jgi:branched-chain amino acid transport system permease protein
MSTFAELLLAGVSLGFVYALVALGFTVIFRATGVVNFAHGSILLLGAYVIARAHPVLGFAGAALAGIAAATLAATLIQVVLIARIRHADPGTLAILTIGANILLTTELTRELGSSILPLGDPWGDRVLRAGGVTIPEARAAAGIAGLGLLLVLGGALRYLPSGLAMRAAADDAEAAALMGVRLHRVAMGSWALAGALAAVGGLFFTTFPTPGVGPNVALVALSAFPAVIIGGLDSVAGAVTGGLIVGVVVTLTAGYSSDLSFLGGGIADVMPWAVMVLVLLFRPAGLFGRKQASRV